MFKQTLSGIDNDTRRIEGAILGLHYGLDAGTSGTEYFDAFESRRETYIGPVISGSLVTTTIAYTYDPLSRLTGANYSVRTPTPSRIAMTRLVTARSRPGRSPRRW